MCQFGVHFWHKSDVYTYTVQYVSSAVAGVDRQIIVNFIDKLGDVSLAYVLNANPIHIMRNNIFYFMSLQMSARKIKV